MTLPGRECRIVKPVVEDLRDGITDDDLAIAIRGTFDQLPIHLDIAIDDIIQDDSSIDDSTRSDVDEVQKTCGGSVGDFQLNYDDDINAGSNLTEGDQISLYWPEDN